jgi:endogenous inhibitor of DNA gyrase (YacG/DUF329 family)
MTSPAASIPCPGCGAPVAIPPSGTSFPFCSPRCRMADLGRWLDGSYALDPETGKLDVIDPDTAEEVVLDDDDSPPRTH